jgi:ribose/xylose/arabinose/galactoside ABC-type transport system permease subunit
MTRRGWSRYVSVLGPFLGILFIYAFFLVYDLAPDGALDNFGTLFRAYTLKTIAAQTTIVAVAALGMTVIIISAGIDLSPGSSIALASVVVALLLRRDPGAVGTAILAGVAASTLVGVVNGALIASLRIVPFIVTLGMMGVVRGVANLLAKEQKVTAPETWLNGMLAVDSSPDAPFWKLPWGVVVLFGAAAIVHVILRYSIFGRHVFAVGSSELTARLCGIRVPLQKVCIYTLAGVLTGIAGVLQFSQLTVGDPTAARGRELDIIASVVIGGGSLNGGKGSVAGTVLGAFLMGILRSGCDIHVIPNYIQEIFIGLIVIAAVAIDRVRQARAGGQG